MIPQDFIDTLLSRVDIVGIIDRHVPLKKTGANYSACCPFHQEKTPSFTVSPTKQFYHCFGCGANGTAINFLMEHTGKGFVDAVTELAQGVGMEVPRSASQQDDSQRERNDRLHESLLLAARYYRGQLKQSPTAIEYLKKRGLNGEIAARYGLGYAPPGWQNLEAAVPDYNDQALEVSGLVIVGDHGRRYDRFRDRVMFPILDARGKLIGFGGRVLGDEKPKYLNSPETPLFAKGRELYGLFQARQAISASGQVLVVEGYMDVIALAQAGIGYAAATLGTATTAEHVQKLFRQTDRVIFSFDGDEAGRRAAWKALENVLPALVDGKETRFLFLPSEHDPDSFVRECGRDAFERLLDQATPLSEYLVQELSIRHPPQTAEGAAALYKAAQPLLEAIGAPALQSLLRKKIGEVTALGDSEPSVLYRRQTRAAGNNRPPAAPAVRAITLSRTRRLLRLLWMHPALALTVSTQVSLRPEPEKDALLWLVDLLHEHADLSQAQIMEYAATTEHDPLLRQIAREAQDIDALVFEGTDAARDEIAGILEQIEQDHRADEAARLLSTPLNELSAADRAALSALKRLDSPRNATDETNQ